MAHAMNFTAWCLGSDQMNSTAAEAFRCENLARGRVLLDCGATDTVGSVEVIEAIIDKSQEALGADHDWVSVDVNDRPVYMLGDAKRKQALSKARVKVQLEGHMAHLHVPAQETEGGLVPLSAKSRIGSGDRIRDGSCDLSQTGTRNRGAVGTKSCGALVDGSVRTIASGQ